MSRRTRDHKQVELVFLTRPNCHLCHEMRAVLDRTLPEMGLSYRSIDVDSDPKLARRYGDAIPVLLRNGRPVAKVRLDRRRLRRIVRRRRWAAPRDESRR